MQKEDAMWSVQRIQGELKKLGYEVCDNTVAKYMIKSKDDDPSKRQRWLTFLQNHAKHILGVDFVVVRTVFFNALCIIARLFAWFKQNRDIIIKKSRPNFLILLKNPPAIFIRY